MSASHPVSTAAMLVAVLVFVATVPASATEADEPHAFAAEVAVGTFRFADNAIVPEGFVGASARYYVRPRVGIGPEFSVVSGDGHGHVVLTGNVTFDFVAPIDGVARAVTPFAVVGAGMFRTDESSLNGSTFSSIEGAFTAGGGVRVRLGSRAFVGAEVRLGWEAHVRANAVVGVRLGRGATAVTYRLRGSSEPT